MKILFISQYFYPEVFRGNDIVFDLAKRNHQVTVLTATPNYPKGVFFDNYSFFKNNDEIIRDVKIYRSKVFPRGKNAISLMFNFISFPLFSFFKLRKLKDDYDIIVVQQLSPLLMVIPALIFKEKRKIPMVSWVLDLWPESLIATTPIKKGFVISYLNRLVRKFYKESDLLLVSSLYFEKAIIEKVPEAKNKIVYFPNWAEDEIALQKESLSEFPKDLPKGYNVMFAGNVGDAQDFESILKAAELTINDNINWVIVGDGRKFDWVKDTVEKKKLDNVYLMGRFPIEIMSSLFSLADAMLVTLKSDPIYEMTVPAKIQAYMSCGKVIFGMLDGEGNKIINDNNIGAAVPAGNFIDLVECIKKIKESGKDNIAEIEKNSLEMYNIHFTKSNLLDKFNLMLNEIVQKNTQ